MTARSNSSHSQGVLEALDLPRAPVRQTVFKIEMSLYRFW